MRYTGTVRREDGSEFESKIDTTAGDTSAVELARTLAESYGGTLVALKDADGKELSVGDKSETEKQIDEQDKETTERVEEQNKTTTERVEKQDVSPNKTGDVRPS